MTKQDELLKLSELIADTTAAHEAALNAASGSPAKVAAIQARVRALGELSRLADAAHDNEVSSKAFAAHDALATVVSDSVIADILGVGRVLDGFSAAFEGAADRAERLQVLTERWATVAEQTARHAAAVFQSVREAVDEIAAQVDDIRSTLG